jgi:hypothetical protein
MGQLISTLMVRSAATPCVSNHEAESRVAGGLILRDAPLGGAPQDEDPRSIFLMVRSVERASRTIRLQGSGF